MGNNLAKLNDQAVAPWMLKEGKKPLIKTNEAFKLYYDAYQKIKPLYNLDKKHIGLAATQAVKLQDLATTGYGSMFCASDLNTIFDHYDKNNRTYKEDNEYVQETYYYSGEYCTVPRGINKFLKAYAGYADELTTQFKNYDQYVQNLVIAKKNKNWSEIGKNIGYIKNITEKTSSYLWMMPMDIAKVSNYVEYVKKWTGGVETIYSFLDNYNKNRNAGMNNTQAILFEGLKTVLKKVPMFGNIYVMTLECVPSLVNWAKKLRNERENQIRYFQL